MANEPDHKKSSKSQPGSGSSVTEKCRLTEIELDQLRFRSEWVVDRQFRKKGGNPYKLKASWPRIDSDTARHRPPADKDLFEQLATCARVPAHKFKRFQRGVSYELDREWYEYFSLIGPEEAGRALKQLRRLKKLSLEFSRLVRSLEGSTLMYLRSGRYFCETSPKAPRTRNEFIWDIRDHSLIR